MGRRSSSVPVVHDVGHVGVAGWMRERVGRFGARREEKAQVDCVSLVWCKLWCREHVEDGGYVLWY